jgi:hypothetical protein
MSEAQDKFKISEGALYNLIKRNKIPKFRNGKYTYVKKIDLEKIFNPVNN